MTYKDGRKTAVSPDEAQQLSLVLHDAMLRAATALDAVGTEIDAASRDDALKFATRQQLHTALDDLNAVVRCLRSTANSPRVPTDGGFGTPALAEYFAGLPVDG